MWRIMSGFVISHGRRTKLRMEQASPVKNAGGGDFPFTALISFANESENLLLKWKDKNKANKSLFHTLSNAAPIFKQF